jgi:hypothetical protein
MIRLKWKVITSGTGNRRCIRWCTPELREPAQKVRVQLATLLGHFSWKIAIRISQSLVLGRRDVIHLNICVGNVFPREIALHLAEKLRNRRQYRGAPFFTWDALVQQCSVITGISGEITIFRRAILANRSSKNYWIRCQVPLGLLRWRRGVTHKCEERSAMCCLLSRF